MTRTFSIFLALMLSLPLTVGTAYPSQAVEPRTFFGETLDDDAPPALPPLAEPLTLGRVVAIDAARGRITLEYRPIPQWFLEGGTRIFDVTDPAVLEGLSRGDKVRFDVEREGRRYLIIRLENSN